MVIKYVSSSICGLNVVGDTRQGGDEKGTRPGCAGQCLRVDNFV